MYRRKQDKKPGRKVESGQCIIAHKNIYLPKIPE